MWDITIFDVAIILPWRNTASDYCNLVTPIFPNYMLDCYPYLLDDLNGQISFTAK